MTFVIYGIYWASLDSFEYLLEKFWPFTCLTQTINYLPEMLFFYNKNTKPHKIKLFAVKNLKFDIYRAGEEVP